MDQAIENAIQAYQKADAERKAAFSERLKADEALGSARERFEDAHAAFVTARTELEHAVLGSEKTND